MTLPPVQRAKQVRILGFRGFSGAEPVKCNTDADIVLLSGPNGMGKTSFMEAITAVLTGWLPDREARALRHDKWQVDLEAVWSDGSLSWLSLDSSKWDTKFPLDSIADDDSYRELDARICAFFQDRLAFLYDSAAKGATLRDVFEAPPPHWQRVANDLREKIEGLEREANALKATRYTDAQRGEINDQHNRFVQDLLEVYNVLAARRKWPGWPRSNISSLDWVHSELRVSDRDGGEISLFLDRLGRCLEEDIVKDGQTTSQEGTAERRALEAVLGECQRGLSRLEATFPDVDSELGWFAGDPSLLDVLRSMSASLGAWLRDVDTASRRYPELGELAIELRAVRHDAVVQRLAVLEHWFEARKSSIQQRKTFQDRKQKIETRLSELESVSNLEHHRERPNLEHHRERLNALKKRKGEWIEKRKLDVYDAQTAGRKQAVGVLHAAIQEGQAVLREYETKVAARGEIVDALKERLNVILRRFSLVEGMLPMKLEKDDELAGDSVSRRKLALTSDDGRQQDWLSTGQRSQVGIALLLAQNDIIDSSGFLRHRILLMDDVSTPYDLSNLTREALTWRKLAYGPREKRRQLFISSHHEDLTNHLLDLLVPPRADDAAESCRLRVLKFVDWSLENGPTIESFEVEPPELSDKQSRELLAFSLKEAFR